jgi:hypothetical protein
VGAYPPPDDVRLARTNLIAVFESGATIRRPTHLPDAGVALDPLDSQPRMKALPAIGEISDEACNRFAEGSLLLGR